MSVERFFVQRAGNLALGSEGNTAAILIAGFASIDTPNFINDAGPEFFPREADVLAAIYVFQFPAPG